MDSTPENELVQPRPIENSQLLQEFVSGGLQNYALMAVRRALPHYVDDLTQKEGPEIYETMLKDPVVESSIETLRLSVLADGIAFIPAVVPPSGFSKPDPARSKDAETAAEYQAFIERCFDGIAGDVASELMDCIYLGFKASEITLKPGTGEDKGKLVLKNVKGKHHSKIAFVVDDTMNVDGLIAILHNSVNRLTTWNELGIEPDKMPNFIPRWKFALASFRSRNGDPRGNSLLRSAYNFWFIKTQILPDFFKFLKQFATPGIIGETAVGSNDFTYKTDDSGSIVYDAFGNPSTITAEMALYNTLLKWLNGSVLAVKSGTKITLLESKGDGAAFRDGFDYFDKQIAQAILGTAKATQEGKAGDKGGSSVAQDIIGLRIAHCKELIARVIYQDIVRLLIRVNFGDEAIKLAPVVVLKKVENQDWARELDSVSNAYAKGVLHDSQLPDIWSRFGFEAADIEAIQAEKEDRMKLQAMAAGDMSTLMNPAGGPVDPNSDSATKNADSTTKNPKTGAATDGTND